MEENVNENENENDNNNCEGEDFNPDEDNELMYIYEWVDSVPLSRQKKNIARDFNDGVLFAEMIKHHFPKLVDLHNYPNASSRKLKLSNWTTLNNKVLKKLGIKLTMNEIEDIMASKQNSIESLLGKVYRIVHGLPLNDARSRQKQLNEEEEGREMEMGGSQGMQQYQKPKGNSQEDELERKIMEKDQEILQMKEYIEDLEKKINMSNENQAYLEGKLRELNDIIRKNEIEI